MSRQRVGPISQTMARDPAAPAIVGCEWIVDAHGCNSLQLQDLALMQRLCQRVIDDLELKVVGQPHWHQFPGHAGVTGLYLLSESHLACHTYPEHRLATFNLYCCRSRPAWLWQRHLTLELSAEDVQVAEFVRGDNRPLHTKEPV
ncbi:MAG: S-adenosylmethionine decarboxylase [Pirellulaceae bacterium]|nr:S-adenosylmethionine decarboxylase [Pirellulaceae bacterium]